MNNDKSKLQASLTRLLKRATGSVSTEFAWFNSEPARKGRIDLSRAGEDRYVTSLMDVREEDDELLLIVDQLMPKPAAAFWEETVSLQGSLAAFDAGMEEIAEFRALVGERVEFNEHDCVELREIADLQRSRKEYVAMLASNHPAALSFVWYGSWRDVKPKRMTINRFFFDAELEEFNSPDGYGISQAMLKLEKNGQGLPVRLRITRARNGEFEAELEKIDSNGRQLLTAAIEEIWRTEAGLSQKRTSTVTSDVGFRKRQPEDNRPPIILLSDDDGWAEILDQIGRVIQLHQADLEELSTTVSENPCDLFVADADLWGSKAVTVERLLRSVSRYRMLPRLWITSEETGQPWEMSDVVLGSAGNEPPPDVENPDEMPEMLDHVDYGAFDLISRDLPEEQVLERVRWAMNPDAFGKGEGIFLVTQDARIRYRLGLAFLHEHGIRFSHFKRLEGLVPALDKRKPRWILLDASSFEVEIDSILARASEWTQRNRGHVVVLVRGVEHARVTHWLKRGARDIVLMDPSLREAMRRLRSRILETE
ncbi:hypothetical protein KQI52_02475 [bacterium]|nr:hypothetical protein [bacterium]